MENGMEWDGWNGMEMEWKNGGAVDKTEEMEMDHSVVEWNGI